MVGSKWNQRINEPSRENVFIFLANSRSVHIRLRGEPSVILFVCFTRNA